MIGAYNRVASSCGIYEKPLNSSFQCIHLIFDVLIFFLAMAFVTILGCCICDGSLLQDFVSRLARVSIEADVWGEG